MTTPDFLIETRPDLRRAFYRLLGVSPNDGPMAEFDRGVQETAHYFIQHGLWNAQYWLATNTQASLWIRSVALPALQTDSSNGLKYYDLKTTCVDADSRYDFLRLVGSRDKSAIYSKSTGSRIGVQISYDESFGRQIGGSYYWFRNNRLYVSASWNPNATDLLFDYYYRHAPLATDSAEIDFPEEDRPLIVAEAAFLAVNESWAPLDELDLGDRIARVLAYWRNMASSRARRTQDPQQFLGPKRRYGTRVW